MKRLKMNLIFKLSKNYEKISQHHFFLSPPSFAIIIIIFVQKMNNLDHQYPYHIDQCQPAQRQFIDIRQCVT